jgi:hypothetical protein
MLIRAVSCLALLVPAVDIGMMLGYWLLPEMFSVPVVLAGALLGLIPVGLVQWKGKEDEFVQKLRKGGKLYFRICQWGGWVLCVALSQLAREQVRVELMLCIVTSVACAVLYWRPGAIGKQKKFG